MVVLDSLSCTEHESEDVFDIIVKSHVELTLLIQEKQVVDHLMILLRLSISFHHFRILNSASIT